MKMQRFLGRWIALRPPAFFVISATMVVFKTGGVSSVNGSNFGRMALLQPSVTHMGTAGQVHWVQANCINHWATGAPYTISLIKLQILVCITSLLNQ